MWSACRWVSIAFHQLEVELAYQLQVAVHLFQDWIDDQRLATAAGGEQVGVGAGRRVEQLAEDHDHLLGRLQRGQFIRNGWGGATFLSRGQGGRFAVAAIRLMSEEPVAELIAIRG